MESLIPVKKVPLQWAATFAVTLAQQIEEGANLDDALVAEFNGAQLSISEALDRRKALLHFLKSDIECFKLAENDLATQRKIRERMCERLKEDTKKIIEENPGIPYVDSFGRKVQVVNNGQPKLVLNKALALTASKTVSNIIDFEQAEFFGIDKKYLKLQSFVTLDTATLKNDMIAGLTCAWAELEYNKQLRGL